ncbi:MAG: hypothetical protein PHZ23_14635 [Acidiphilium sp.]|nr:hypothetical protein [Acidiphilium sp.]
MSSCNTAGFHAWARDTQWLSWSEQMSGAFFAAYCRAKSARERDLLWFVANNERYRDEPFGELFAALKAWAAGSRTKEAKQFRDLAA